VSPEATHIATMHVLPTIASNTVNTLDTFALTAPGIDTRLSQIRKAGPRALTTGLIVYVWLIVGGLGITWAIQRLFE
jgi:uncharacterized membrane protein YadS